MEGKSPANLPCNSSWCLLNQVSGFPNIRRVQQMKTRAGCGWRSLFCLHAEKSCCTQLSFSGLDPYLSLPLTPAVAAVMMFSVVSRTALNVDPSACISSPSTNLFLILILQQVCIFLSGSNRTRIMGEVIHDKCY